MSQPFHTVTIEGHLERITYVNPDNHYTIAKLKPRNTNGLVTVIGSMPAVIPGQMLKIKGNWETHSKYGQQFKIKSYEITLPATIEGVRKYLASGIIKGIGSSTANRMINRFGSKTFEIIEKNPEKLIEVKGIGKKTAALIHNTWKDHHAARDLMQFLQEAGVKTSYCAKILSAYGKDAVSIIRSDPYRLSTDIPGVGFYIADTIASKLGAIKDQPRRVKACILHIMGQFANEGHVFTFENRLLEQCKSLFQIDYEITRDALDSLSEAGELVIETASDGAESRTVY
ncbi:MAG: hypothetical protein JRF40_13295 [Deltaproteobacteria bacterium]|nr:hypothetical protein [Deltaproteobacteria bacterium]